MNIKKIVSFVLTFCIVFSLSLSAFATENENSNLIYYGDEWCTASEIASFQTEIESFYEYGLTLNQQSVARADSYLYVSALYQDDSKWSSTLMPCGHKTYGAAGCAMTSYAMVLNYYGYSLTPVNVATTYYNNHGDPCSFNSSTLLSDYSGRSRTLSGSLTQSDYSSAVTAIKGAIASGYPVVVKLSSSTYGSHFVVCYGYNISNSGETYIIIRDPLTNGYTTLNAYYNAGRYPVSYTIIK